MVKNPPISPLYIMTHPNFKHFERKGRWHESREQTIKYSIFF